MVNITLSVPDDMKFKMDSFVEINWSAVAREAFSEKISDLEIIKSFKAKSKLTEEDALKLGRELNNKLAKRRL
jgi:hypothetical protein